MPRRDEFDIGQPSIQDYPCDNCKKVIKNATVPRCCNGNGYGWGPCGCMGLPTEPVTCSARCEKAVWKKYNGGRDLICPDCNGAGSFQTDFAECCQRPTSSGECCGQPIQMMENRGCETCQGHGRIRKPSRKNKKPRYTKVYRGILIEVRTGYAHPRLKSQQVCVHTPDIERYFKSTAGVRRFIDKFLSSYNNVDNGIPF